MLRRLVLTVTITGLVLTAGAPAFAAASSKDTARAKKALLQKGDVPAGYTRSVQKGDLNALTFNSSSSACAAFKSSFKKIQGTQTAAYDATFNAPKSADAQSMSDELSESIAVFKSSSTPKQFVSAFSKPAMEACLSAELANGFDGDTKPDIKLERIKTGSLGDQATAFRATMAMPGLGTAPTSVRVDFVLVRKGRALALLSFTSLSSSPFPQSAKIAKAAAKRLQAAA